MPPPVAAVMLRAACLLLGTAASLQADAPPSRHVSEASAASDVSGRGASVLNHFQVGPDITGNHNPTFKFSGSVVEVKEDSGPYKLGAQFATDILDNNMDSQSIQFECRSDNEELFTKKPDIVACPRGFCVGTVEVPPGTGTLIFTPRTDRFGTAIVKCYALDDGITFPVCGGGQTPPCAVQPCNPPLCNQSPLLEFTIKITKVNDQPEFIHLGDVVSEEDVEQCIPNWARDVTAGGWEEGYGARDPQELRWNIMNDNTALFKTQPYIKYTQGGTTGDLCFTPADDLTGVATAQVYLSDTGGRLDGGVDDKPPQTITITIKEVNDPPRFTPGELTVHVDEDCGAVDIPWATRMMPGPTAEVRAGQQLDKFVLTFVNPAHVSLFKVKPTISTVTGHLQFEPADDANTYAVDCALIVYLVDAAAPPDVPAQSAKPWPVLHIAINPVNDPPSYTPPQPQKDVTVLEGQGVLDMQWARDVCVGKRPPNCVVSEGFAGGENQKVYFEVSASNKQLFAELPQIDSAGRLTFRAVEDQDGVSTVTVRQFDTGPPPNEGPSVNFVVTILPVNDPPRFELTTVYVELEEDASDSVFDRVLDNVSPGPEAEWGQMLTAEVSVSNPWLFSRTPEFRFRTQKLGPTFADLIVDPAKDRFGFSNLTFLIRDDGKTENTITWTEQVQKDASGSIGITYRDVDVVYTDPDGTAHAAGIRRGMKIKEVNGQTVTNEAMIDNALLTAPDMEKFPILLQNGTDLTYGTTVLVHVKAVNDPPQFLRGSDIEVVEDNPKSLNVFKHWAHSLTPGPFEEGLQQVVYDITHTPEGALAPPGVALTAAGDMNFTLAPDFFGSIDVSVRVSDADIGSSKPLTPWSSPQVFVIKALPVNDPPVFETIQSTVAVIYCPPVSVVLSANCTRDYPGWARDLRTGPANEADQRYDFTLSATDSSPADWVSLFEPHHYPTVSRNGDLHFTLQRGALPKAFGNSLDSRHSILRVKVVMHDDGGTANGGIDENTLYIDMDFTDILGTAPPATGTASLVVIKPADVTPGQSYVTSPLIRSLDVARSPALLPAGSLIRFLLIPLEVPGKGISRPAYSTTGDDGGRFASLEAEQAVRKFYQSVGGGEVHSFSANTTSIYDPGQYQYACEVRFPSGTSFRVADEPFKVGAEGSTLLTLFKESGVVSGRGPTEWDLRLSSLRLVVNIVGNSWAAAAEGATVSLRRAAAAAPSRGASTLQTGVAQVTPLASKNSVDTPDTLSLALSAQPVLNLLEAATLEIAFPAGSVAGPLPPAPIILPLGAAPTVQLVDSVAASPLVMTEAELQRGPRVLYLQLSGDVWVADTGFSYVVEALSSESTQPRGFNAVKASLLSVQQVSPNRLQVTLGPHVGYEIGADEVVRLDTAFLRVQSGVQPDFDFNPSTFAIAVSTEAVSAVASSGDSWYYTAAIVMSIVTALAAVSAAAISSPVFLSTAFAVPLLLQCCGTGEDTTEVLRGIRWWIRPRVLRFGGSARDTDPLPLSFPNIDDDADALLYAQGALLLVLLAMFGLHALHVGVVMLHKQAGVKTPFVQSAAQCRYPGLWVSAFMPLQVVGFHNSMFIVMDSGSTVSWRVVAVLFAVFTAAAAAALIAFTVREADRIAACYDTTTWVPPKGASDTSFAFQRQHVLMRTFYASHDDDQLAGGELTPHDASAGAEHKGLERKGAILMSYTPGRVFFAAVSWLWLLVLSLVSAHAAQNVEGSGLQRDTKSQLAACAILTAVCLVAGLLLRPLRSHLLEGLQAACLGTTTLVAVGGQPGAIFALIALAMFAVLFAAVLAVTYRTNRVRLQQDMDDVLCGKREQRLVPLSHSSPGRGLLRKSKAGSQDASPAQSVSWSDAALGSRPGVNPIARVFRPSEAPIIDIDDVELHPSGDTSAFHAARSTTPLSVGSDSVQSAQREERNAAPAKQEVISVDD